MSITFINAFMFAQAAARRWRVRYNASQLPEGITGVSPDARTIAELMFMTSAGAGAQPGTGSAISSGTTGSTTEADAFDGNAATYANLGSADGVWIGFNFDTSQAPTHVSITARTSSHYQAPRSFFVDYSGDGGSTWTVARYLVAAIWTSGSTQVFDLSADGYASDDLSALDEVGGYRYYAIQNTGDSYQGLNPCFQTELVLKKSGSVISTAFHRNRGDGFAYTGSGPFDGVTADAYFSLAASGYVLVDLGYKRVVDQVGVTHRTFASGVQGLQTYDLLAGNSFDIGTMSVIKSVNDTLGSNPPGAGVTVLFSVP